MLKKLKGNRTRLFNVIGMLPLIAEVLGAPEVLQVLPASAVPYYSIGLLVGNLVLRQFTNTPAGQKY